MSAMRCTLVSVMLKADVERGGLLLLIEATQTPTITCMQSSPVRGIDKDCLRFQGALDACHRALVIPSA